MHHICLLLAFKLTSLYVLLSMNFLCSGRFGVVVMCKEKSSGHQFAAKRIVLDSQMASDDAWREFEALQRICHPRLALLEAAFETSNELILIEEL